MKDKITPILKRALRSNEAILWSHIVEYDEPGVSSEKIKKLSEVFKILWIVIGLTGLVQLIRGRVHVSLNVIMFYGALSFVLIIIQYAMTKSGISKRLESTLDQQLFQNGIITTEHIILCNDDPDIRTRLQPCDLKTAYLDYYNGGRVLKIVPRYAKKEMILVGVANFEDALKIIKSRFIQVETNP